MQPGDPARLAESQRHNDPDRSSDAEQDQAWEQPPTSRLERWALAVWQHPVWLAPAMIALCGALAFGYVLTNNPTDAKPDGMGPCAFKTITGYDCPGCGGTRMVWYLLHGNLIEAGQHHLMALLAVPIVGYAYVVFVVRRFTTSVPRWLPKLRIPGWTLAVYAAVWASFAVLRNIPVEPFSWFYV